MSDSLCLWFYRTLSEWFSLPVILQDFWVSDSLSVILQDSEWVTLFACDFTGHLVSNSLCLWFYSFSEWVTLFVCDFTVFQSEWLSLSVILQDFWVSDSLCLWIYRVREWVTLCLWFYRTLSEWLSLPVILQVTEWVILFAFDFTEHWVSDSLCLWFYRTLSEWLSLPVIWLSLPVILQDT